MSENKTFLFDKMLGHLKKQFRRIDIITKDSKNFIPIQTSFELLKLSPNKSIKLRVLKEEDVMHLGKNYKRP